MSTGDIYTGNWLNGKKQGKGIYRFGNSDLYEGILFIKNQEVLSKG